MKKFIPFILVLFLVFGCAGLKQSKTGKDYTSIFAKSGLNIDTNSNDKVDEAYGGTDSSSMEGGLDKVWSSTGILKRTASETYDVATENTDYAAATHASRHGIGGADVIDRYFEGVTVTQAVPAEGNTDFTVASKKLYYTSGLGACTVDDFSDSDGDHTDFSDGDYFGLIMNDSSVILEFSDGTNISGNLGVDFTGDDSYMVFFMFVYYNGKWYCTNYNYGFADPLTIKINSLEIPYSTSGDATLTQGRIQQKSDEDAIALNGGSSGEVQGEVLISMLQHLSVALDPTAAYNQDSSTHNFPLFTVGDDYPHGIKIVEWQCTYTTGDPSTELNANLYRASDWSWTSETSMDALDTTNGTSSEDTAANINSGNAVANGQKVYIGFDADPADANVLVIFEMWFYAEED